ncbi:hypothetical protein BIFPSEUDO_04272 [Bifidobacterium pseudocatenulatum DSM 20438 = JCM 1200 = LMG 10505]|uniref:Uncharacterized protein n=1 Tax=Bifidobacterium pseudocatenulatum DSM 20438 = JCM 1200 = LMG 10505 TaxID=547043 RepID=C0BV29_BIFPS|nr:hypothetical protein BIFPSEUDO_04272 [Bifidobacterium pseudocatenulatum DSM 20438 = JCM 1200 = LMG 10505]
MMMAIVSAIVAQPVFVGHFVGFCMVLSRRIVGITLFFARYKQCR